MPSGSNRKNGTSLHLFLMRKITYFFTTLFLIFGASACTGQTAEFSRYSGDLLYRSSGDPLQDSAVRHWQRFLSLFFESAGARTDISDSARFEEYLTSFWLPPTAIDLAHIL